MSEPDTGEQLRTVLGALSASNSQTLVRAPQETIVPPREALPADDVLKRLAPIALEGGPTIGEGGMGLVREATQVSLERKVAVKTLRAVKPDAEAVQALLAEARLAGGLEHPNIVPVHDLALDPRGLPVMVMKRVEGVTWSKLLHDPAALAAHAPGREPLAEHLRILVQVCHALDFAHSRGVVHRDLKPDNVMVGRFGEVFIVDWGIASVVGPATHLAGTPAYLAPEMLGAAGSVLGPFTDVYLLGAVLHEVLTGRPPHQGDTPDAMVKSVLASKPVFPADAPAELVELATRCMKRAPADRPQGVAVVRAALEDFLLHQGSRDLAKETEARLAELLALLAEQAPDPRRLASLASECRFGFQHALRTWPANVKAKEGLQRTIGALAHHELSHGSASAARALLAELPRIDPDLAGEVEKAVAAEEERQRRLEALAREHNPRVGGFVRAWAGLGLGVVWTVGPLAGPYVPPELEGWGVLGLSLTSLFIIAAASRWGRPFHTLLNRQLIRFLYVGMGVEVVVMLAVQLSHGMPGPLIVPVAMGYWALLAAQIVVTLGIPILPVSIAYAVATVVSLVWPQTRFYVAAAANLVLSLNAVWLLRFDEKR